MTAQVPSQNPHPRQAICLPCKDLASITPHPLLGQGGRPGWETGAFRLPLSLTKCSVNVSCLEIWRNYMKTSANVLPKVIKRDINVSFSSSPSPFTFSTAP